MNIANVSFKIVDLIVDDLTDRRGLRHEWDNIDEDIQQEIRDTWRQIIETSIQSAI